MQAFQAILAIAMLALAAAVVACAVWLHVRAMHDGAIHDPLLYVTGISLISYVCNRWNRARRPVQGIIGSSVLIAVLSGASGTSGESPREQSPEQLAAEMKPLILKEWQKNPAFENVTIQGISLASTGGGHYSGFVDATLAGKTERLPLAVALDGGTIRWTIVPKAN